MIVKATKRDYFANNVGKKSLKINTLPAVVYNYEYHQSIVLDRHDFEKIFPKLKPNSILTLQLPDVEKKVVVKDYAVSLKGHRLMHIDFYVLGNKKIKIRVPLDFKGLPIGISKGGLIRRSVESILCSCKPENIPTAVEVDISKLDIDDCIYLKDLPEIKGIEYLESKNKAIVSVIITSKAASKGQEEASTEKKVAEKSKEENTPKKEKSK